jgi:DNA-binding MarR family transcriptional regulator
METVSMYCIRMEMNGGPTIGYLVWRLSMQWRTEVDRAVKPLGLTHSTYSVIATLLGLGDMQPSQRELADHTGLDPVYISKLVTILEGKELVSRHPSPKDTRAFSVALTERGRAIAIDAMAVVHPLLDDLTAPLGGTSSERVHHLRQELQLLLDNPKGPSSP